MSKRRPALVVGACVIAIAAMVAPGCDDTPLPRVPAAEPSVVVGAEELALDFDYCQALGDDVPEGAPCGLDGAIDLRMIACSAKLSCAEAFLHDPLGATPWECERVASGACRLWAPSEMQGAARCLGGAR